MTTAVQRLLDSFERLSEAERQESVVEILRRSQPPSGDLSDRTLVEIANELFCALDEEEA